MISLVFIDRCDGALSPFVWHLAALHDCIEDVGELTHTPITKVFECLSRYSIWSTALTILQVVLLLLDNIFIKYIIYSSIIYVNFGVVL